MNAKNNQPQADGPIRLNKFLAESGVASRRKSDELIASGKVFVDGHIVTEMGTKVDPAVQRVEVNGVILKPLSRERRYYLLNKPAGVVCTNDIREQRRRAIDLIRDKDVGRIYTVGRLDEDTTGLIILTDDGDFAHRIMHPRFEVMKTYRVKVRGRISDEAVQKVREGVYLAEGKTAGARVVVQRRSEQASSLIVSLGEGKNREIRRVFARVGARVTDLRRTHIGRLGDRGLKTGQWRRLLPREVEDLLAISNGEGRDFEMRAKPAKPNRGRRVPFNGRPDRAGGGRFRRPSSRP